MNLDAPCQSQDPSQRGRPFLLIRCQGNYGTRSEYSDSDSAENHLQVSQSFRRHQVNKSEAIPLFPKDCHNAKIPLPDATQNAEANVTRPYGMPDHHPQAKTRLQAPCFRPLAAFGDVSNRYTKVVLDDISSLFSNGVDAGHDGASWYHRHYARIAHP